MKPTAATVSALIISALLSAWGWAGAATLRVEKDGSGEYTVIQDAINAASAGDTLLVGPGRYDTFFTQEPALGGSGKFIGIIRTNDLTIIGENRDTVVIGPEEPVSEIDTLLTVCLGVDSGIHGIILESLTLENTFILLEGDGDFELRGSRLLSAIDSSVRLNDTTAVRIVDCEFQDYRSSILALSGNPNRNLVVARCSFQIGARALSLAQTTNVLVSDCEFESHVGGINFWLGSSGRVEKCRFRDSSSVYVSATSASTIELVECELGPGASTALRSTEYSLISGMRNLIGESREAAIAICCGATASFSDCDILNGGKWSVYSVTTAEDHPTIDLRNNWWGTLDPAQVTDWIYDGVEVSGNSIVEFEPLRAGSIPVEGRSMGGMKALFGGRR